LKFLAIGPVSRALPVIDNFPKIIMFARGQSARP
jgi:hypothetical protein